MTVAQSTTGFAGFGQKRLEALAGKENHSNAVVATTPRDFDSYLACVACLMRENGEFVSAKQAYGTGQTCTADAALALYGTESRPGVTELDFVDGVLAVEFGKTFAREVNSDYASKVGEVLAVGQPTAKNVRYVAPLVKMARDSQERKARDAARAAAGVAQNYVGTIGTRQEFLVILNDVRVWNSDDGFQMRYFEMSDEDGNNLTWGTTAYPEMKVGGTYLVAATVKRHSTYRGELQTYVNRLVVKREVS